VYRSGFSSDIDNASAVAIRQRHPPPRAGASARGVAARVPAPRPPGGLPRGGGGGAVPSPLPAAQGAVPPPHAPLGHPGPRAGGGRSEGGGEGDGDGRALPCQSARTQTITHEVFFFANTFADRRPLCPQPPTHGRPKPVPPDFRPSNATRLPPTPTPPSIPSSAFRWPSGRGWRCGTGTSSPSTATRWRPSWPGPDEGRGS